MKKTHRRKELKVRDSSSKVSRNIIDSIPATESLSGIKKQQLTILALIIIIVCMTVSVVHWPVLSAQAFYIDDDQYVSDNLLIQNPSLASVNRFFSEVWAPSTVEGYYQPMSMISLMIDYALGGRPDNLTQFHRTSLILHVVNTVLIIILLFQLFGNEWISGLTALIFGLHPMTVETIAWVSDRKTLLATFFSIICLLLYIVWVRRKRRSLYFICLLSYLLAVLSKPTSMSLPLLMIIIDLWLLERRGRVIVFEKIPFFLIAVFFAIVTYVSQSSTAGLLHHSIGNPSTVIHIFNYNIVFYFYKIAWPFGLPHYNLFPKAVAFSDPIFTICAIGACIVVLIAILSWRHSRDIFFGLLFFFVALLPTIQFFQFAEVIVSDKYVYLPSLGLLLMAAALIVKPNNAKPENKHLVGPKQLVLVITFLFVCLEVTATRQCLAYWIDSVKLYEHLIEGAPESPTLNHNIATILKQQGDTDKAIEYYKKTLVIRPDDYKTHSNLGITLKSKGNIDEAIRHLDRSIALRPDFAEAYCNMGVVLEGLNKANEALVYYEKALEFDPDLIEARINRGLVLMSKGLHNDAVKDFQNVLELNENIPDVQFAIGMAKAKQGRYDEAVGHYKKALELKPDWSDVYCELGNIYVRQQNIDQAIVEFSQALKLQPDRIDARIHMADISAATGEEKSAIKYLYEVLDIDPNHLAALCRLIVLL